MRAIQQGRNIFTTFLPMVPLRDVDVDSISRTILAYKTVGLLTEDHHLAWQEHLRNVTESLATRCDMCCELRALEFSTKRVFSKIQSYLCIEMERQQDNDRCHCRM